MSSSPKASRENPDSETLPPAKAQRMSDEPVPLPKVKAARTDLNVRMVGSVETCHNDEVGIEEDATGYPREDDDPDPLLFDDETNEQLNKAEGEGPPAVDDETVSQLDSQATLDELQKLRERWELSNPSWWTLTTLNPR